MKRAVIVHGFQSNPISGFKGWLKTELEKTGFTVFSPALPNPKEPRQEEWVETIAQTIGEPDQETYLIGHSLGCMAILRYLEQLPPKSVIGGAVFIAGFTEPLTDDRQDKRQNFFKQPLNWNSVNQHCSKIIALFSDNDWAVPLDNTKPFKQQTNTEVIVLPQRGHFATEDHCVRLPEALEAVLKIAM